MKTPLSIATILFSTIPFTSLAPAQSTDNRSKDFSNSRLVTYMMSFDAKHDGKLTRDEITDTRMLRFFDLADANRNGVVTKEELTALAATLDADLPAGNGRGGPGGRGAGPGGFDDGGPGGPPGRGRGPGGRGMMGGPPRPGQVLPPMAQQMLNLTDDQKKQVDELQKEVDAKLAKILTPQQLDQLKQMPGRGPGGRGGFGPGGPGGPPPQDR